MKLPTARDFAGLYGLEIEGGVIPPKDVVNKLREIVNLLDREGNRPYARLEEAFSIESRKEELDRECCHDRRKRPQKRGPSGTR